MTDHERDAKLVKFPFSKSGLSKNSSKPRNLGLAKLSREANTHGTGAKGHWCKTCKGIWYTYFFEVECPVCSRRG